MILKEYLVKFINKIMRIFPIKKNRCFLYSSYGANYGCNPKYISEYLVENSPEIEVIWAFNYPEKYDIKGIKKVKNMSLKYFYYLATSKFIITNFRTSIDFKKRNNQIYIYTSHGGLGIKMIEKDAEETLPLSYIKQAKEDSKKIDYFISGCKFNTEVIKRAFWYEGKILEIGTPRNDFLLNINKEKKQYIRKKIGILEEERVLLYAPTFRKNNNFEVYDINFDKLLETLEKIYKCKWKILMRLHPHLINFSNNIQCKNVINMTTYDDIQELLGISDILISDYSGIIFDYLITGKPCFLYAKDLEEYRKKERKLYFELSELPFLVSTTNEELNYQILNFNEQEFKRKKELFLERIGDFEKGRASAKVSDLIMSIYRGE